MKSLLFSSLVCAFAAFGFGTTPAHAAGNVAYLSATGSGSLCTQSNPCSSISTALGVAGPEGEVICLNKGNYGAGAGITQSVTISCGDGLWEAPFGVITVATRAGSKVVIEGVVMDNVGLTGRSILFTGQGSLELRRIRAGNLVGSAAQGVLVTSNGPAKLSITDSYFYNFEQSGILVQPSSSTVDVHIRDSVFSGNGFAGISVVPGDGKANVALDHVTATGNAFGLRAGGNSKVSVRDSIFTGNTYGVVVFAYTSPTVVELNTSTITENSVYGLRTNGSAGASVSLSQMRIFGNGVGVSAAGGAILSFGNNAINGNTTDGAPTGSVALK